MSTTPLKRLALGLLVLCTGLLSTSAAVAQTYPNRPVRMIVPFAPGGGTDLVGRLVGQSLSKTLGQPIVIDNRGGAGTAIGSEAVAKAPADGYTILLNGSSMAFLPAVQKIAFNVEKDFRRVTLVSEQSFMLVVNNDVPAKNMAEFVALAKRKPDDLTYVSAGIGSATHMASELLWRELGVQLVHIPYKGTAPAVADLLAGNVKVMYTTVAAAAELVRNGKVRPLAISSSTRNELFPAVPTVSESAKAGFVQASTLSLFVPAATPLPVAERIFNATIKALDDPELRAHFKEQGLTPVASKSLAEADAHQRAELARWAEITKGMGLTPN